MPEGWSSAPGSLIQMRQVGDPSDARLQIQAVGDEAAAIAAAFAAADLTGPDDAADVIEQLHRDGLCDVWLTPAHALSVAARVTASRAVAEHLMRVAERAAAGALVARFAAGATLRDLGRQLGVGRGQAERRLRDALQRAA